MNRRKVALFALLIVFALATVRAYLVWPRQKTVVSLKYAPGQQVRTEDVRQEVLPPAGASRDEGRRLRLDLLEREQTAFRGYRRNLFKPIFVDEVKVMKQKAAAPQPALSPAQLLSSAPPPATAPVMAAPVPTQAEIQRRELANFSFLGFLKKDNRKTIFLARDRDIVLVRKGEHFAGRYQAIDITDQALTIRVTDSSEEIVIPLVENRPLAPR